ncbi:MAG: hypothetical protein ABII75_03590 [Candidatus Omnitrophota bacterium]
MPDKKSNICQFRITDMDDGTVTNSSGTFYTYPEITNVSVIGAPLIADTKAQVQWSYTAGTTQLPTVDILVDLDGDDDWTDAQVSTLQSGVPFNAAQPYLPANSLPVTLSDNAKIRVRDSNPTFKDIIKADTTGFVITGQITVTAPTSTTAWKMGELNKNITWTYKGAIGNVNIEADYNGDGTYDQTLTTVAVGSSPYVWPVIPNQVSNNVKIKVESVDKPGVILDESDPFDILGGFEFTNILGQVVQIERDNSHYMDISWTTTGAAISKVQLEYTPTGLAGDYVVIDSNITNTYTDGVQENSYTWMAADMPTTVRFTGVKLRLSSSVPLQPETNNESDGFLMCGNVYIATPAVGAEWVANGITPNTISWELAGTVDTVKISYAQDGTNFNYTIVPTTNAHNVDATHGSYPWTIPTDVTLDLLANGAGKIKIEDTGAAYKNYATDTSQPFTIKGILTLNAPTGQTLTCGQTGVNITWTRQGKIDAVDVSYSRNNASTFPNPIQSGVTFGAGLTQKTISWTVPEYVGCSADGNGYAIRVEDVNNSDVKADSPIFTVKGQLLATNTSDTWAINTSYDITWDVIHGNIANVKIIGSRDGTWGGAAEFTIINSRDADNVTGFDAANFGTLGYAARGSYPWNIAELTPSIISDAVKIKVLDADTDYSVESIAAATFNIIGKFQVTAPKLGDIVEIDKQFNIKWTTWGSISDVKIEYSTNSTGGVGGTWTEITPTTTNDGVYEWTPTNTVPITDNLFIKVTDITQAGGISDVSDDAVKVKGWFEFTNGVDTPLEDAVWKVGVQHEITWTKHGNISNVNLEYSPTVNEVDFVGIASSISNTGSRLWTPNPVTMTLSSAGYIRVSDAAAGESANNAVSSNFRLVGVVNLTAPVGGEIYDVNTTPNVTWNVVGNVSNVRIDYSKDGGNNFNFPITAETPAGGGASTSYPWNIGDNPSPNVVVRVADKNAVLNCNATSSLVDPIRIKVIFDITSAGMSPLVGNTWGLESPQTIKWSTVGTCPQVKLELSVDEAHAVWEPIVTPVTGIVANTDLGVEWNPVLDRISDTCIIRVSDPRDPETLVDSGEFVIRGKLTLDQPNGGENLNVGGSYNIKWTTLGTIASVKLEYSVDEGVTYPPTLTNNPIATLVVPTPNGQSTFPWSVPDEISAKARVKVTDEKKGTVTDDSNANFNIRDVLAITGASFTQGETLLVGTTRAVGWTKVGSLGNVKLEYSVNGAAYQYCKDAANQDAANLDAVNDNPFTWKIPDAIDDNIVVRVSSADGVNAPALPGESVDFKIKGILNISKPEQNEILGVDDLYAITFDDTGSIDEVKIEYSVDGAAYQYCKDQFNANAAAVDISGAGPYTFIWKVPNQINGNITVLITDTSDPEVSVESNPFEIAARLVLLTPNGGSFYEVGHPCPISWEKHGTMPADQVDLSYDTNEGIGGYGNPIITIAASDLSYSWSTPDAIGNKLRVKIKDNAAGTSTIEDTSDANFEIRGKLELLTPPYGGQDGNVLLITSQKTVSWRKWGNITSVRLEYTTDGTNYHSLNWNGVVEGQEVIVATVGTGPYPVTYNYAWTIPDNASNTVKVKVTNFVDTNVADDSGTDPFLVIRGGFAWVNPDPLAAEVAWVVDSFHTLEWDTFGTISTIIIDYSTTLGAAGEWKPVTGGAIAKPANDQYSWQIPNDIANPVYLRIYKSTDETTAKVVTNVKIKGSLEITRPDGTQHWRINTTEAINWTKHGDINLVKLEYSKVGGGADANYLPPNGDVIFETTAGAALTKDWEIPQEALTPNAVIRISDVSDPTVKDESVSFKIKASFSVTTPNSTHTWVVDEPKTISWTTYGPVTNVNLYYWSEGISDWVLINIAGPVANTGSYPWQVADNISNNVKIRVRDANDVDAYGDSEIFKITGSLTITSPGDTDKLKVGSVVPIIWTRHGSISDVNLDYFDGTVYNPILTAGGSPNIPNEGAFAWTVPDNLTTQGKIRIKGVGFPAITHTTAGEFKIMGGFTVTYPNGGEPLLVGTTPTLTWTSTSAFTPNVRIDYSTASGAAGTFTNNITTSTPNDGNHPWTITNAVPVSGTVRLRVADAADPDNAYDDSNSDFRIRASFTVLNPNGGNHWIAGRATDINGLLQNITWTSVGTITNVKLEFSRTGNFVTDKKDIGTVPNTGVFPWTIPDDNNISDTVLVRVSDPNDAEAYDDSNAIFKITAGFALTSPNGTEDFDVGGSYPITWTCTSVEVTDVKLEYSTNGGLGWNPITATPNDGAYTWNNIPNAITTAARVKVSDLADDTAKDSSNADFNIRADFDLIYPNGGDTFTVTDVVNVTWDCNGTVDKVALQYTTDDTNWTTIAGSIDNADNVGVGGVDGSYAWTVTDPISQTLKLRIADADVGHPAANDPSDANFRVKGDVWVKAPVLDDRWDIGQPYDIKWGWNGIIPEVKITYSINGLAGPFTPILENYGTANDGIVANAAGAGGAASEHSRSWAIPDQAAADVIVRVQDSRAAEADVVDDSGSFHIVGYIIVKEPNTGDRLTITTPFEIKWEWGGTLPTVKITYSINGLAGPFTPILENYGTANDGIVANGAGGGGPGSEAAYLWTVEDHASNNVLIRVEDPGDSSVYDDSDTVKIICSFNITSPNGTERWVTRETRNITWNTTGTISKVDLLYSKDNFGSDIHIIASDLDNTGSYPWTVPDDRSTTVKVRVRDANEDTVYDDSNANFTVDYYNITFEIKDLLTNQVLSALTIDATSNKGDSIQTNENPNVPGAPLGSPATFAMPYGTWTTVWSCIGYGDAQATFIADADKTLDTLYMETSAIHIWRAYSDFTYEAAVDKLKVTSWLERDGFVVSGAVNVEINIYDDNGDLFKTMSSNMLNSAGFFNLVWAAPTGLESGVLYSVVTIIDNASGAQFKTPTSFSITETKQMEETEETIKELAAVTFPAFQTAIQSAITTSMEAQEALIELKMNEQINLIDTKTTEMKTSVDTTLSSFEQRSEVVIDQLQAGAEKASVAGEELQTIAKRQSGELILPNSVLVGESVEVRYRINSGLMPLMDVVSYDGVSIMSGQPLMESTMTKGLYGYDIYINGALYKPGKAFTVIVTESSTGNLQAGSVMVESTSLTSIEGLTASIPQIRTATDNVLSALQGVEGALSSRGDVGLALTTLQDSVDALPGLLQGGQASGEEVAGVVGKIYDRLSSLAGEQGFDISGMVESALSQSPTIQELTKKTENIKSVVKFLHALFEHKFGGMEDEPIVSTSLSSGSVIISIVAANPSSTKPQRTKVKVYLPVEITPKDIMDVGGLDVEFDADKSIYYVYKDNIELGPKEIRVYKVEMEDIWFVPQSSLDLLKMRAAKLQEALVKTEYADKANELAEEVYKSVDAVIKTQSDVSVSKEQHIGYYRNNLKKVEHFKEKLVDMEKLLLKKPEDRGILTWEMTWKLIVSMVVFVGVLATVFFLVWQRHFGTAKDEIKKAKQFSFPTDKEQSAPKGKASDKKKMQEEE